MTNEIITGGQVAVSTIASAGIAMSVNAEPLITALITFGVSIVTLVGTELVKFLVAFIKHKRQKIEENIKPENKEDKK